MDKFVSLIKKKSCLGTKYIYIVNFVFYASLYNILLTDIIMLIISYLIWLVNSMIH